MTDLPIAGCRLPLFVGEMNPYGSDPYYALYCQPEFSSGGRLRKILGLTRHKYVSLYRTNLCNGRWSLRSARSRANRILASEDPRFDVIATLGRKVQKAFGLGLADFFTTVEHTGRTFVVLPHPSGLSRAWNDPSATTRTRQLLSEICPELWEKQDDSS